MIFLAAGEAALAADWIAAVTRTLLGRPHSSRLDHGRLENPSGEAALAPDLITAVLKSVKF